MGYKFNPLTGDLVPIAESEVKQATVTIDLADSFTDRNTAGFVEIELPTGLTLPAGALIQIPMYIKWADVTIEDTSAANGLTWARNTMPPAYVHAYTDDASIYNIDEPTNLIFDDIFAGPPSTSTRNLVVWDDGSGTDFIQTTTGGEVTVAIQGPWGVSGTFTFIFNYINP